MRPLGKVVLFFLAAAGLATPTFADTITFDFAASGIGPEWSAFQTRSFWAVATDSRGLRISKPADDGSSFVVPDTRSDAGLASEFTLAGNFATRLAYAWNVTATPAFSAGDNSASLVLVSASDPAYSVAVSSVSLWNGTQRIAVNYSAPLAHLPAGTAAPTPLAGTLAIARTGSTMTFFGNSSTALAAISLPAELRGAVHVFIDAHQGQGWADPSFTGIDPRDPMDVSFSEFTATADSIRSLGEPSALILGVVLVLIASRSRRRSRRSEH